MFSLRNNKEGLISEGFDKAVKEFSCDSLAIGSSFQVVVSQLEKSRFLSQQKGEIQ